MQCRTWYIGSIPLEDHPWPALPRLGSATRNCGGLGAGHAAPHHRPRQQHCVPRRPIRGRRGSKRGFACHGYTLPQPNYQQVSTGAPPACSLIYGGRSREGKVRGSRGGSNKHGHYTCKYSTLCSSSAFPLSTPVYFPITNKLVAILHVSGCKGLRGEKGSRCRLILLRVQQCWVSPSLCLPGQTFLAPRAVFGQSRCPYLPARPGGSHGARPRPRAVSGTQNKAGASPPHRPAQTSSLEYLPVFQGSFPWGQAKQKLLWGWPCPLGQTHPPHLPAEAAASQESSYETGMCRHSGALSRGTPQLWYLLP